MKMQIAGKTVDHVECHLYVMDKISLQHCEDELVAAINVHKEICESIDDQELQDEYNEAFVDDFARAEKALEDVQWQLLKESL
ncbi:MAG: hypothetical protein COA84_13630 [Robiginitomaculum sp.]|nr:MAG: hypothetical protein COA84_13630 [Robiginitomaculum sp.]